MSEVVAVNPERARYEHLWGQVPEYRNEAPGANHVMTFLERAKPHKGARIIDFGCGTGRASRDLWIYADAKMVMLDFAENCLDPGGKLAVALGQMEFHVTDLTQPIEHHADFGYCTDVLEHIAPPRVADQRDRQAEAQGARDRLAVALTRVMEI